MWRRRRHLDVGLRARAEVLRRRNPLVSSDLEGGPNKQQFLQLREALCLVALLAPPPEPWAESLVPSKSSSVSSQHQRGISISTDYRGRAARPSRSQNLFRRLRQLLSRSR